MSKPHVLSAIDSVYHGLRMAGAQMVVSHPMPFSLTLKNLLGKSEMQSIDTESFSAALNAGMGSVLGGKRTFVFGQVNSLEDLHNTSYMRLPVVMGNISRSIGTYSPGQDHTDIMALRDSGWLLFLPQSNLEVVETLIQAYKVSETCRLPSAVSIDMPHLSETLMLPNEKYSLKFVGKPALNFLSKKAYVNVGQKEYAEYKKEQQKAMGLAMEMIEKTSEIWKKNTRRSLPLIEEYKMEDADYAIVIAGYHTPTAAAAVDKLRAAGQKVGLLRIRVLRPFPAAQLTTALAKAKHIAVVDQSISLGNAGILYNELKPLAKNLSSFISLGLHLSEKHFVDMVASLQKGKDETVWL